MKIIDENCDPKVAEDPKLPYTAYLIQYADKEVVKYDLSIGYSKVELFDHYYDKYKKDFVTFKQAGGIANPKTWYPAGQEPKKPKRKRKD